jgi:hypothetical protein
MQGTAAVERARQDRLDGRPWKARERLRSFLTAHPTNQEALDLVGEVHYEMGDLPAAGAAWFLCTRDDDRSREAVAALRHEYERSPRGLIGALRVRAPIDAWPPPVQERLRAVQADAARRGIDWTPAAPRSVEANEHDPELTLGGKLAGFGCGLLFVFALACTIVGLVVILDRLVGLVV